MRYIERERKRETRAQKNEGRLIEIKKEKGQKLDEEKGVAGYRMLSIEFEMTHVKTNPLLYDVILPSNFLTYTYTHRSSRET